MTDDKAMRRNLAAQAKWLGKQSEACWETAWALDAYRRGCVVQSWTHLFMAQETEDEAAVAYAEWDAL
jgi:hypothetical protein